MLSDYIKDILAVDIEPDRIIVTSLRSRREIEDLPLLAIDEKLKVVAVGSDAEHLQRRNRPCDLAVLNPFSDPRVAVTDVEQAAVLLRRLIERFYGRKYLWPWLAAMIHPPRKFVGDLTALESRGFMEMAMKAGVREAWVVPTDQKLSLQDFNIIRKSPLDTFTPLIHDEMKQNQNEIDSRAQVHGLEG